MTDGPLSLVVRMAQLLDELRIPYALGGSMASSLVGEPRSTVDVDMAVRLDATAGEALLERVGGQFYVLVAAAREAIRTHSSFNLLDTENALKVDLFVVGDGLLDRMQIERRVLMSLPGADAGIWVTSPEDQVLRRLDWFRGGAGASDHQWRDVVGILRVLFRSIDLDYLYTTAAAVGLAEELSEALREVGSTDP